MTDTPDAAGSPDARELRIAEVLQQVRSAVRQRQAEVATAREGAGEYQLQVLELRRREFVAEPQPTSHRAGLGRLIVGARKAAYHLFLKWLLRPLLEQQNAFNLASSRLLQELVEAQERAARERRELQARVAELERRLPPPAAPTPAS